MRRHKDEKAAKGREALHSFSFCPSSTLMAAALPALDSAACELLVTRGAPHVIVEATQPWLDRVGYSQGDISGRSVAILQGEGTCAVTLGALWSALQVKQMRAWLASSPPACICRRPHRRCRYVRRASR